MKFIEMKGIQLLFLVLSLTNFISSEYNSLNEKHLIVGVQDAEVQLYVKRNISGHIIKIDGVAVRTLTALANRYNFTYSILQVNDTRLEKQSEALPGLTYYMQNGKCDLVIGALVMTPDRYALMDFAEGYAYSSMVVLIPMPESSDNGAAITQPFQISVWIGLMIVLPVTAVALYFSIDRETDEKVTKERPASGRVRQFLLSIGSTYYQIARILLNQGAHFPRMRTAVYFVVGSWCLGALILGCAYNSLLISYILGSNAKPLVDSAQELVQKSNVQLIVDKGRGTELFLTTAKQGLYKQMGDKLRTQSKSNCATRQECIDLVKLGSYAYLNVEFVAISAIAEDYKATGKCNLALVSQKEAIPGSFAWALPKRSPYTRMFTKGFMELHEAGLMEFWIRLDQKNVLNATYCLNEARKRREQRKLSESETKISLKSFSGAFYVLVLGYFVSFVCFVREVLYFRLLKYRKRSSQNNVKHEELINPNGTTNQPAELTNKRTTKIVVLGFVTSWNKKRVIN